MVQNRESSLLPERPALDVQDWWIFAFLTAAAFLFRLMALQPINVGPDELDYWFAAKRLFSGFPFPELTHRTVRYGVLLPVWLSQRLFGFHPLVYTAAPLIASALEVGLMFRLTRRLAGRGASLVAALLLMVFPYMIRSGSQIRPEVFSVFYLLIVMIVLVDWHQDPRASTWRLTVAALAFFLAYGTKITNLYFLPPTLLFLGLSRKNWRPVLLFGGILFALYVVEHLSLWAITGDPLGHAGLIINNHLNSDYDANLPKSFLGLFARYEPEHFPLAWWGLFILWLAATLLALREWKDAFLRYLVWMVAAFFFFQTFAVKSLSPIDPVESFQNRYFTATLPFVMPVLGLVIGLLCTRLAKRLGLLERLRTAWSSFLPSDAARIGLLGALGLALSGSVFYFGFLPAAFDEYYTRLDQPEAHPAARYVIETDMVKAAWEGGMPIVTVDSPGGFDWKALDTIDRVYLNWEKGPAWEPKHWLTIKTEAKWYYCLVREGSGWTEEGLRAALGKADQPVLLSDRKPFRIWAGTMAEVLQSPP